MPNSEGTLREGSEVVMRRGWVMEWQFVIVRVFFGGRERCGGKEDMRFRTSLHRLMGVACRIG